ncbi:uncharacterized protein TNCV_4023461 [Trichonephila clavipes]|nr:uncharacterized protein TNCV_4023461 [Trichonephila clavipes]
MSLRKQYETEEDIVGVFFHPELPTHVNKQADLPAYLKQLALEKIGDIPIDRSDDYYRSGSGIYIKSQDHILRIQMFQKSRRLLGFSQRRFVEWAQNEIAVVPDFHKRILFSDEAHFWLNGYVNKQNCRIWSEANPQVYVETPLHPEKLTVWCALWAGGILLQKR